MDRTNKLVIPLQRVKGVIGRSMPLLDEPSPLASLYEPPSPRPSTPKSPTILRHRRRRRLNDQRNVRDAPPRAVKRLVTSQKMVEWRLVEIDLPTFPPLRRATTKPQTLEQALHKIVSPNNVDTPGTTTSTSMTEAAPGTSPKMPSKMVNRPSRIPRPIQRRPPSTTVQNVPSTAETVVHRPPPSRRMYIRNKDGTRTWMRRPSTSPTSPAQL